mmetsp:Transcript_86951/g.140977  ORF Transcript_86951/g.140977 Transcript_86951/m.140977 type:complete len:276 (+) Transcript_86951:1288-2115(+)
MLLPCRLVPKHWRPLLPPSHQRHLMLQINQQRKKAAALSRKSTPTLLKRQQRQPKRAGSQVASSGQIRRSKLALSRQAARNLMRKMQLMGGHQMQRLLRHLPHCPRQLRRQHHQHPASGPQPSLLALPPPLVAMPQSRLPSALARQPTQAPLAQRPRLLSRLVRVLPKRRVLQQWPVALAFPSVRPRPRPRAMMLVRRRRLQVSARALLPSHLARRLRRRVLPHPPHQRQPLARPLALVSRLEAQHPPVRVLPLLERQHQRQLRPPLPSEPALVL